MTLGVPMIAAHMFVFYFAVISGITPPVALAAYAGAGIAKAPPMMTALYVPRLSGCLSSSFPSFLFKVKLLGFVAIAFFLIPVWKKSPAPE